jgi:DNA-binding MarR family transcriptional regulator
MVSKPRAQWLQLAPRRRKALLHLAAYPYASNREIGSAIGISDDAQVSRMLARMQDLGLALNCRRAHDRGRPNAWQLTDEGRRMVEALEGAGETL